MITMVQQLIERVGRIKTTQGAQTLAREVARQPAMIEAIARSANVSDQCARAFVREIGNSDGLDGLKMMIEHAKTPQIRRAAVEELVHRIRGTDEVNNQGFFLAGVHYQNSISPQPDQQIDRVVGRALCSSGQARRLVEEHDAVRLEREVDTLSTTIENTADQQIRSELEAKLAKLRTKPSELEAQYNERYLN